MSFYTDKEKEGNLVILTTDRTKELDRIENTGLIEALDTIWCEGGVLIYYKDRILFVDESGGTHKLNIDPLNSGIYCYVDLDGLKVLTS